MSIFDTFRTLATKKKAIIGIGHGNDKINNEKIINVCLNFVKEFNINIKIFSKSSQIVKSNDHFKKVSKNKSVELVESEAPEVDIIKELKMGNINAVVRGSMSSTKFLNSIKNQFKIEKVTRLALLETIDNFQFFYGPVGIDECNSFDEKKKFIERAIEEFNKLSIEPKISILSGGRRGDLGRNSKVDKTIEIAEKIVNQFSGLQISHDEILIESAINKKANLIIAPDGISGNLIYRTLVHLGGGNAYGAIYTGIDNIIIDTSRVGKPKEIEGALLLALALS
ncbi:MAG: methanogenesis marker protein Mmp4/MtxX [Promethearchaeota archaeon]